MPLPNADAFIKAGKNNEISTSELIQKVEPTPSIEENFVEVEKNNENSNDELLQEIETSPKAENKFPLTAENFIEAGKNNNLSTSELIQKIDTPPSVAETSLNLAYTLGIVTIPLIGIIITIILLVKSIKSKNKLMKEISLDTINHIHKKAIILLVLSIIGLSLPAIILTVISLVLTSNAKKLFDTDLETIKSKLNIASTLNIISIVLLAICFTVLVFAIFASVIPILRMVFMINAL